MAQSFSELRKSRKNELQKLTKALDDMQSGGGRPKDERFWNPTVDKAGNGFAILRFLPPPPNEDLPLVRWWDHGFRGPTGLWYIENNLNSIGKEDPVSEMNRKLWAEGEGSRGRRIVSGDQASDTPGTKRRLHFVSGIKVITDPAAKDNEGKVFLYKYGAKIYDKIREAAQPTNDFEKGIDPFDFDAGANFILKIRKVKGYRNYDSSQFEQPSPLSTDEKELEAIWNSQHSLAQFLHESQFKSYAELKARLDRVMAIDEEIADRAFEERKVREEAPVQRTAPAPEERAVAPAPAEVSGDEGDVEGVEFFRRLAEGDKADA